MKRLPTVHEQLMEIDENLQWLLDFCPEPDPKVMAAVNAKICELEYQYYIERLNNKDYD